MRFSAAILVVHKNNIYKNKLKQGPQKDMKCMGDFTLLRF